MLILIGLGLTLLLFPFAPALLRLLGAHRPIVKPDLDNYIKSAFDALNGVLWADDAMVVDLHAKKFYSEHPHITIEVSEIAEK